MLRPLLLLLGSMLIQFYHLTTTPLENALPKLLEKAFSGGYRALVVAETQARVEQLNALLWTYDADSFLPHASANEANPEAQPILLATGTEPLNKANLLVITDGRVLGESDKDFERVLDIFDGNDANSVAAARTRWTNYKNSGYEIAYFRQVERGGWEKKT